MDSAYNPKRSRRLRLRSAAEKPSPSAAEPAPKKAHQPTPAARQATPASTADTNDLELPSKALDVLAFNQAAERVFVLLVHNWLAAQTDGSGLPVNQVIQDVAFDLDISIETAKRYLTKHSASRAPFQVEKGRVLLRLAAQRPCSAAAGRDPVTCAAASSGGRLELMLGQTQAPNPQNDERHP